MDVILLERVAKLGQMGDVVKVKPGYARNFLLPQKKALRATEANKKHFETQRAHLEAVNLQRRKDAEAVAAKMAGFSVVLIRQASEALQLSARGFHRTLRVARTLADLDDTEHVSRAHVAEALSYRGEALRQQRAA